jgi:hypothetical protein
MNTDKKIWKVSFLSIEIAAAAVLAASAPAARSN